ncbi:Mini-ribonuclease 3 [Alkaliphilus serpentinus]|uniref:Mini-ribonuclease 3 n=1 Tax=Alkaliphilus serpentinus TaxID=1482731 RepID=A0A833M8B2_9FIRM|nr:ribonuclease III domain-containing protein [Alkaliphilus serpentinus]KAB3532398.1 Mini-ribonuclease 3 [Alkaliphilus serpentinus]
MADLIDAINNTTPDKDEKEVKMMAPLVLAYMGDSIFEVYIRNYVISRGNFSVHQLHKQATKYVKAKAQATIVHALEKELNEEEWAIVKKGRNQKSATVPKNAELIDYKYATGFEALLGYLYYTGKIQRLKELMEKSIDIINVELNK